MDIFSIESTRQTPKVFLDPDELDFVIRGISRPENADKFYMPVLNWLKHFSDNRPQTTAPLSITVKLTYFNSSSIRYITEFFRIVGQINKAGMKVIVDWCYDTDDSIMRESGLEVSEISGVPFNYIEE